MPKRIKTITLSFRTTEQIVRGIERTLREGLHRNKTEVINEALRVFLRGHKQLNADLINRVGKK